MTIEFFDLGQIAPNPFQPRETLDPAGIAELAANILATRASAPDTLGLLQTPRGRRRDACVQLAYGHRRLAAFRLLVSQGHAGYATFPVELAELSDADMAVVAWSENAVRSDINPMEEAHFIRRLVDEFGWTLQQAADRLGMSRSILSNVCRLVNLPQDVQDMVANGEIARSRGIELCGLLDRIGPDEISRLAHTGKNQDLRTWHKHTLHAHADTTVGLDVAESVIEPAARVLADALQADEPGAWLIVARAIDPKGDDASSAGDLARIVIERVAGRSRSIHDGKRRINTLYEAAGLETPWNAAALAKVTQFLSWKQKHKRTRGAT